jgi:hypothetical protein
VSWTGAARHRAHAHGERTLRLFFPVETSQKPFHDILGTPAADRKYVLTDANHFVLSFEANLATRETLDWLDRYLGPVGR